MTGTARANSGIVQELVDLKKNDKGATAMEWGTVHHFSTESNRINQIGWEDSALSLVQTSVFKGDETVETTRKLPRGEGAKHRRKFSKSFPNGIRQARKRIPKAHGW